MLGTAGSGRGIESALASAKLENEIRPDKILINTMSAFIDTKLDDQIDSVKIAGYLGEEKSDMLETLKRFAYPRASETDFNRA